MAIREIQAKTLLARVNWRDAWFGMTDNMNLYRGCQHQCIYCDTRSECYQVDSFDEDVLIKANAITLLRNELAHRRSKGIIGTGSMNDPYMPLEAEYRLTHRAIETIAEFGFGVHITTKSALARRDLDLLQAIGPLRASVLMTITTTDDALGRILEPGASLVSERFTALDELAAHGITIGVALMPVLPFIEDNTANITAIINCAAQAGAGYLIHALGMTLRDRQRAYFTINNSISVSPACGSVTNACTAALIFARASRLANSSNLSPSSANSAAWRREPAASLSPPSSACSKPLRGICGVV